MKEERDAYVALMIFAIKQAVSIEDLEKWTKAVLNSDEHKTHRVYFDVVSGTTENKAMILALNKHKAQLLAAQKKAA